MSKERHEELSSKGGKRAHELGNAHQWTSEEASKASQRSLQSKKRSKRRKQKPEAKPPENEESTS